MDAGILIRQRPWQQAAQVLEHVLCEKRCERSHHPGHGVDDREKGLQRLQTLRLAKISLDKINKYSVTSAGPHENNQFIGSSCASTT